MQGRVESFNKNFCFIWNVLPLDTQSVLLFPVLAESKQDGKVHLQKQQTSSWQLL